MDKMSVIQMVLLFEWFHYLKGHYSDPYCSLQILVFHKNINNVVNIPVGCKAFILVDDAAVGDLVDVAAIGDFVDGVVRAETEDLTCVGVASLESIFL